MRKFKEGDVVCVKAHNMDAKRYGKVLFVIEHPLEDYICCSDFDIDTNKSTGHLDFEGWMHIFTYVDPKKLKHADDVVYWIEDWESGSSVCPKCKESFLWEDFKGVAEWNYCPNCGVHIKSHTLEERNNKNEKNQLE